MRRRYNPEVIGGRVNGDGTIAAGDNFSIRRQSAGVYLVTLPMGFEVYAASVNPWVAASAFFAATDFVDNTFIARSFAWNTANTAGDCPFVFTAVGVQR